MAGFDAKQGLERGHGQSSTIVAKDEFVEINLELIAPHPVASSVQPLLQVANRAVCQGHNRPRAFAQVDPQRLVARHVLESCFAQPSSFETVGVYC